MIDEELKKNAIRILLQKKCDLGSYESILAGLVVYQNEIFASTPAPSFLVEVANAIESSK